MGAKRLLKALLYILNKYEGKNCLFRGKGAVINLSSFSSLQSTPLLSVYSSTKAFVNQFSQDLEVNNNIAVHLNILKPDPVRT